jgi:ligand-binding sensor domain-containing protein/signal transduction histidine kinase
MSKTKKTLLLLAFLLFLLETLFAQTLAFRHYADVEGMPDAYIKCMYQDSKGYLWFGTPNGVGRFDGLEFRKVDVEDGLSDDFILDILEDRNGHIWIGTARGGVSRFSQAGIKNFTAGEGLAGRAVTAIAEDREGILWFGTEKGVSRFDGRHFTTYTKEHGLAANLIIKMAAARDGTLWLGTMTGLSCFKGGRCTNYTTANGLTNNNIHALLADSRGRLWIGTQNGLNCLDRGKFSYYTTVDGLPGNQVMSAVEARNGNIWFGTDNGISLFAEGKFTSYTTRNGLRSNSILSLLEDREGNLWIGTTTGASCLNSLKTVNYSVKNGLPHNMVWSILADREGRYWIGTEDGLSCYAHGRFKNYTTRQGLIHNKVYGLMEDRRGKIWIATDGGLSVYARGKFTNYNSKDGLSSNVVTSAYEDRQGVIWIGTLNGLNRYGRGGFLLPHFDGSPLSAYILKIMEDRQGNLWLPTPNGLYRISSSRQQMSRFSAKNGLPHSSILSVTEDSGGRIWIGTKRGLACFEQGTFITYTTADGLPDNKCYFVLEDDRHYLWIGTTKGLVRCDGRTFKNYGPDDGFPVESWSNSCGLKDSNGDLWFGSGQGVSRFIPALDRANTVPPPVYLTHINVLEKEVPLHSFRRLAYNQNYLKFGFVGLCFSAPERVGYRYRLEGIDNGWRQTRARSVSYPYLPAGDYRFTVKAVNNDGLESREPAEVRFTILPPFWQTWWFRILLVLAVLWMLVFVVIWRIRREKEKMAYEARTRQLVLAQQMELLGIMAAGAVHDLKNLLAVILGYSKMAEKSYARDSGSRGDQHPPMPIEKIKKTATTAIQVVQQMLAFTRQRHGHTTAANLVELLTDILDILNITRPPDVKISWQPPPDEIRYWINPIRFQQVAMNLCFNAIQAMPRGGELQISLSRTPADEIVLEVGDTGCGIEKDMIGKIFDPLYTTKEQGKGTGLGLFVVKQIVAEYGGTVTVHSEPAKGSRFTVSFPSLAPATLTRLHKRKSRAG